jgi:hypothetical protein
MIEKPLFNFVAGWGGGEGDYAAPETHASKSIARITDLT